VVAPIAIFIAFVVGLVSCARGLQWWLAWTISSLVMPGYVLWVAFLEPVNYEWWLAAITLGSIYGAVSGAIGVAIAEAIKRSRAT
jgi:hypothetical protein